MSAKTAVLTTLLVVATVAHAQAKPKRIFPEFTIASAAEQWHARSPVAKQAYLEGMCEGLGAASSLEHLSTLACTKQFQSGQLLRFCAVSAGQPDKAIAYTDTFYRDPDHSDLPMWTVVGTYNEKACGETHTTPQLAGIQAKVKCLRVHSNMHGATQAAKDAQMAECRKLGF